MTKILLTRAGHDGYLKCVEYASDADLVRDLIQTIDQQAPSVVDAMRQHAARLEQVDAVRTACVA